MQATRTLPTGYTVAGGITLKENRRLVILLNVLGIPWFILCAVFFIVMAALLGAFGAGGSGEFTLTITPLLVALVVLIVITFAILVLHEMVHGLFFWLFTRARPRFGFKGAYAYAAAPGWYIPRPQFLAVGLAPLLLISLVGLLILPLTTPPDLAGDRRRAHPQCDRRYRRPVYGRAAALHPAWRLDRGRG